MTQLPNLDEVMSRVDGRLRELGFSAPEPPPPPRETGSFENFGNAFYRALVTQPRVAFNELTGDHEEAVEVAREADRTNPVREGFSGTLGSTFGSLLPVAGAIAAAPFTGGTTAAALGAGVAGLQGGIAAGSALHDVRNYEDRTGEDIGAGREAAVALGNGALVFFTSKFGISKLGNIGKGAMGELGEAVAKRQAWKSGLQGAEQFTRGDLAKAFARTIPEGMIRGATIESLEEAAEQAGSNAIDAVVGTGERSIGDGVLDAAIAGGIGGALLGPLSTGANFAARGEASLQDAARTLPDGDVAGRPLTEEQFLDERRIPLEDGPGPIYQEPSAYIERAGTIDMPSDDVADLAAPETHAKPFVSSLDAPTDTERDTPSFEDAIDVEPARPDSPNSRRKTYPLDEPIDVRPSGLATEQSDPLLLDSPDVSRVQGGGEPIDLLLSPGDQFAPAGLTGATPALDLAGPRGGQSPEIIGNTDQLSQPAPSVAETPELRQDAPDVSPDGPSLSRAEVLARAQARNDAEPVSLDATARQDADLQAEIDALRPDLPEDQLRRAERILDAEAVLDSRTVDGRAITPEEATSLRNRIDELTADPQVEQAVRALADFRQAEAELRGQLEDRQAQAQLREGEASGVEVEDEQRAEGLIRRLLKDQQGAVSIDNLAQPVIRLVNAGKVAVDSVVNFGKALVKRFGEAIRKHVPRLWKAVKEHLAQANRRSIGALNPGDAKRERARREAAAKRAAKKAARKKKLREERDARFASRSESPSGASEGSGAQEADREQEGRQEPAQSPQARSVSFPTRMVPRAAKKQARGLVKLIDDTVGALFRWYSRGHIDRIARADPDAAKRFQRITASAKSRSGTLQDKFGDKLRRLLGKAAYTSTGREVTNLSQYEWDGDGAESRIRKGIENIDGGYEKLTAMGRGIVDSMRELVRATGELAEKAGLQQIGPDGKLRKFNVGNGNVMLRMGTADYHDILNEGPTNPAWKVLTKWLSDKNDMKMEDVNDILFQIHEQRAGLSGGSDFRRANAEFLRAFKRFPDAIRVNGDDIPLLHTNPTDYVNAAIERMAWRTAFTDEFGAQHPGDEKLLEFIKSSKADNRLLHEAMLLAHGLPIDKPLVKPGTVRYKAARGLGHTISMFRSMALSAAAIPNTVETALGNIPAFFGHGVSLKAMRMAFGEHKSIEHLLEDVGAFTEAVFNGSYDPNFKGRSAARMMSEVSASAFGLRYLNEKQELMAGAAAKIMVDRWRRGIARDVDTTVIESMGFDAEQARELATEGPARTGKLTDLEKQFIQRAVPFLTSANTSRLENSAAGNSRWFRSLMAFQSYGMMKVNSFVKVVEAVHKGWNGGGQQKFAAGKLAASYLMNTTAQGAANYFLMAYIFGGEEGWEVAENEAADKPLAFLRDSFIFSTFAGMFGQMARVLSDSQDLPDKVVRSTFPGAVFMEVKDLFTGERKYSNQSMGERVETFFTKNVPIGRLATTQLAAMGLSDRDAGLESAQRAYWRWAFDEGVGKRIKDFTQEEDVLNFKKHMRRATEAMKRGQSPAKHLNKALRIKGNQSTSASIRARKMLDKLSLEQQKALRKRIGDSAYRKLQQWDNVLDGWANAMK